MKAHGGIFCFKKAGKQMTGVENLMKMLGIVFSAKGPSAY